MAKAVQFGAGSIGRGFLGQLLFEGGCETTFVDADTSLVNALNARGEYPLRLVSDAATVDLRIGRLRGLDARRDAAEATQSIVEADLVSVAVGVGAMPHVASALAAGINARAARQCGPINVLLCENQWHAASLMRQWIAPHLTTEAQEYFAANVGLVATVIGRMVPRPTAAQRAEDLLLVVAEPYKEWPVARAMLRADLPPLPGLIAADQFEAYEARKLFLHNMSHAVLAYLGHRQGHEYVWQCAANPEAVQTCRAALAEVVPALAAEYGLDPAALAEFSGDLLRRFANRALGDTVPRVAADPLRKLRPEDRLVGAARLCLKHCIMPEALARVIAAALRYDCASDPAAQELQRMRGEIGDAGVLETVCKIAPGSPFAQQIQEKQNALAIQ